MSTLPAPTWWTDPRRIAAVRKWHRLWEEFSQETAQLFVRALPPGARHVLDLASGTGEPALSVARALGANGSVVLTDVAHEILAITQDNARAQQITNVAFDVAELPTIPFPDSAFDAVTCRFGIMFVPDAVAALRQCLRVLRRGGKAIFLVWHSAEQPFWASTVGQLRKYAAMPMDSPDLPSPFRFAGEGVLKQVFEQAGFAECREETVEVTLRWRGTAQTLREYFLEFAGFYRPHLDALSREQMEQLEHDIERAFSAYAKGNSVELTARVVLVLGIRP